MRQLASPQQLRASYVRWALLFVPGIILLGMISGMLSVSGAESAWFDALVKPAAFPPPATFRIVWPILYATLGLALALIVSARGARGRGIAVVVFAVQLALNLAWSPLFFGAHQMSSAFVLLVGIDLAVMATIFLFWQVRPAAGALLLPYLAWVLFATYLNWAVLDANRALDGQDVSGAVQRIEL